MSLKLVAVIPDVMPNNIRCLEPEKPEKPEKHYTG
jgi:hypothetical protein